MSATQWQRFMTEGVMRVIVSVFTSWTGTPSFAGTHAGLLFDYAIELTQIPLRRVFDEIPACNIRN